VSAFLQQHAIRNVWCTPEQDRQAILKPVRYGKVRGVYERIVLGWDELQTPTRDNYIVYQIGHYPPALFGLKGVTNTWLPLAGLSSESKCTINIYNTKGLLLPLHEVFIIQLDNKTVLLAIRESKYVDMVNEDIYFHHYTNAYWASQRSSEELDFWVEGITRISSNEQAVLTLYNKWHAAKLYGKKPQLIHNGVLVESLPPANILVGDTLEVRVDDSIEEVIDISLDSLYYAYSNLDNARKYVVDLGVAETIRYHDDIEIRICKKNADGLVTKGLLLNRNKPENVRMLASATYSVNVDQVEYIRQELELGEAFIRLTVRESGYKRPLIFENNRLHELNKLPEEQRYNIITGKVTSCSLWDITSLERSAYPKVMRLPKIDSAVTIDLYRCYGYNSIAYYSADNQQPVFNTGGIQRIVAPEAYRKGTMVEYDKDDNVLAIKRIRDDGLGYSERETALVEFFEDEFVEDCPDYYNTELVPSGHREYRLYHRLNGTQDWVDITKSVSFTDQKDGFLRHNYSSPNHEWVVRHSGWAWSKTFVLPLRQGVGEVSLVDANGTMELPFRRIIVRLNGKELVQGIDYEINRQSIWISSTTHLKAEGDNEVFIVAYDFPDDGGEGYVDWGRPEHVGWVDHGMINVGNGYDLHSGLLYRANVDNKHLQRSYVERHEEYRGVNGSLRNGAPYSISMVRPRLQAIGIPPSAEKSLRSDALSRDKIVRDYLTLHAPIPPFTNVSPIPYRHQMYSIFCARILDDAITGVLHIPDYRILDSKIKTMVKQYEYLLKFDIAKTGLDGAVESGLVSARPHASGTLIEVPQKVYSFMDRVSLLYLNGRVDMTGHLTIKTDNGE
tara:strand:+ start:29727 stop:32255 length:2529 start_codon:yes stop_codon:yes gene_type:complete